MRRFLFVVLLLTFSPSVFAHWCEGYRADSYGRGIEAGFKGLTDLRPRAVDESCYQLGVREGRRVRGETQIFDCDGDFERAYAEGRQASALSAGTACYGAGYSAGLSALRVAAREGNEAVAGSACVAAYRQGLDDGQNRRIPHLPTTEQPMATCYRAGHGDADWLR